MPKMPQFTKKFQTLFKAVLKGNVNDVRGFLRDVPVEALFFISPCMTVCTPDNLKQLLYCT